MIDFYRKMKIGTAPREKREKRSFLDRRTGEERRKLYHVDFLDVVGYERRKFKSERRQVLEEKRANWVRVSRWSSVCIN